MLCADTTDGKFIYVCSKTAYGNMPLGAIPLPESKPSAATLPKTRGRSVKELTGEWTAFVIDCHSKLLLCRHIHTWWSKKSRPILKLYDIVLNS